MSQPLLVIGLIELAAVLLVGCSVLIVIDRRKKRQRRTGIEALLEDIKDRQPPRTDRLARALAGTFKVDDSAANAMAASLIGAEKQFLQLFVKQQMQQQPLDNFYENLCVLLDDYIDNMRGSAAKPAVNNPVKSALATENLTESQLATPEVQEAEPKEAAPTEEAPPPPDWGDVFD